MSIALEKRGGIARPGFVRGPACYPIYEVPEAAVNSAARRAPVAAKNGGDDTCSSSSIGRNSDLSAGGSGSDGGEAGEAEVQSRLKGPLETMDALEDSLPVRRGISNFYSGKSKSFASLADAISSSSAKDLAKSENGYTRKRKNLLAFSILSNKPQNSKLRSIEGHISKKPANSSRSMLSPMLTSSSSGSNSFSSEEENDPAHLLPPRYPQGKYSSAATSAASLATPTLRSTLPEFPFPVRSFSLTDLQGVICSTSSIRTRDKHK